MTEICTVCRRRPCWPNRIVCGLCRVLKQASRELAALRATGGEGT